MMPNDTITYVLAGMLLIMTYVVFNDGGGICGEEAV